MDDALELPTTTVTGNTPEGIAEASQSSDEEDGAPDWTRLAAFTAASAANASGNPFPKRGEKEFEPVGGVEQGGSGTNLQQHKLARTREAMFAALDFERTISRKVIVYTLGYPITDVSTSDVF